MKLEQKYLHLIDSDRLSYATGIISTREAVIQVLTELESSDAFISNLTLPKDHNLTDPQTVRAGLSAQSAAMNLTANTRPYQMSGLFNSHL